MSGGQPVVEPTPPRGIPALANPALAMTAPVGAEIGGTADRGTPSGRSRPPAPNFDFGPRAQAPTHEERCARCSTSNPPGSRFCAACGAPLTAAASANPPVMPGSVPPPPIPPALVAAPVVAIAPNVAPVAERVICPRCRGANAADMRYCQFCGARIDGAQVPAAPVLYPPATAQSDTGPESPRARGRNAGPSHQPPDAAPDRYPAASHDLGPIAHLVVIAQDGSPGREYPLIGDQTDIGREEGSITLPNDPYVSPRHCRVVRKGSRFYARDLDSVNGVYVRLREPRRLEHADLVLVGLEVLRFEVVSDAEKALGPAVERGTQLFGSPASSRFARLCQRTVEGVARDMFYLSREETVIGRESGDIVFTGDPFMSRRHAAITRDPRDNTFILRDLGSSNGTYLKIRGEIELRSGDHVRIGQHLFRLDIDPGGPN
jgi:pSer/pThr/pTyr-binding forkhead associated (FHA) protein